MLVGLSGILAGYNGTFEFKSGEKYPEEINYTFMRAFNAMFGVFCVPLAYWTARELKFQRATVWLVTLMVLCENSYTTISRFILLDSMLLFGTVATVFCWSKFHNQRRDSFEPEWFFWLFMTGLSIGCVTSVKLVGLCVTGLVGLYTAQDLWIKFGDVRMPVVGDLFALRFDSFLMFPDYPRCPPSSSGRRAHRHPLARIHALLRDALCHPRPHGARRCSDELSLPGKLEGN